MIQKDKIEPVEHDLTDVELEAAIISEVVVEPVEQPLQPVKPIETRICLNLGCGYRKMGSPDWINIDSRDEVNPDMVLDVTQGLPFEDNSVDEIKCIDFLEHVPIGKTIALVEEIYRVLKPGGKWEILVPSTDGRGAFQDPFHVSFWNANSFLYFCDPDHRGLYGIKAKFIGNINTIVTNKQLLIFHVHAILEAVKE